MNFTGGVIHVVDSVLTIPMNISSTAVAANLTSAAGALMSAKLVQTLDGARDVTVFAPNNAAFQAIGSALPNMTSQEIARILEYHVVNGTVGYSSTLKNGTSLKTMNGESVTISMVNGTTFVNSAKVLVPDVLVANGVLHIIDKYVFSDSLLSPDRTLTLTLSHSVLNPNMTSAMPNASATSQSAAFSGASSATDVPYTSGVPTPTTAIQGGAGAAQSSAAGGAAGGASSSTKSGAAMPMRTGAIGAAALFAAGGAFMNV